MDRYRNKFRSDSFRLKNWDYGSPGYYYVTICTKDRVHYFGDVLNKGNDNEGENESWEGVCGGVAGTHDHASLPPFAHPTHVPDPEHNDSNAIVRLTPVGITAYQNWMAIPNHFPFVSLDEFVVMPNHLHGILLFLKPGYRERTLNSFGPQSKNLASAIRGFKSATKSYATSHKIKFEWQARYYDDVITSGKEREKIRQYIRNNPKRWIEKNNNN